MGTEKPFLIYIEPGSKWYIEDTYKNKCELLSRFFDGVIITYGNEGNYYFKSFKIIVGSGFIKYKFKAILAPFYKLMISINYLLSVLQVVRERRKANQSVDLIVAYDPLVTGFIGLIASKLLKIPLVVEINGDYTNWSNYSDIKSLFKRKFKRKIAMTLEGFVLKYASGIQLLHEGQIDYFENKIKKQVVRQFIYYLDTKNFENKGERNSISIIGFPFDVKGIDVAIAAFNIVSQDFPEWNLEILGWFPKDEASLISKLICDNKQIIRLNAIPRENMPEYIGKTGIVLCASRTEGFPRVLVEAMVSGKACIASNVGGIPSILKDHVNGLIFESEDIHQLSQCFADLLGSNELRKKLAKNAYEYASTHFTDEVYVNNLQEFYMSVIESSIVQPE